MEAPQVKSQKVYVVIESVLEAHADPSELHDYLRENRFTGRSELVYDANYNQGGVRTIVTREHIPVSMKELDQMLALRGAAK